MVETDIIEIIAIMDITEAIEETTTQVTIVSLYLEDSTRSLTGDKLTQVSVTREIPQM